MSIVYTISSGESDDDSTSVPGSRKETTSSADKLVSKPTSHSVEQSDVIDVDLLDDKDGDKENDKTDGAKDTPPHEACVEEDASPAHVLLSSPEAVKYQATYFSKPGVDKLVNLVANDQRSSTDEKDTVGSAAERNSRSSSNVDDEIENAVERNSSNCSDVDEEIENAVERSKSNGSDVDEEIENAVERSSCNGSDVEEETDNVVEVVSSSSSDVDDKPAVFAVERNSSSSLDVDVEPVENAAERKSTGSQKGKRRASKTLAKQIKKQKLAAEKLAKKAAEELNKVYKPGECMKYMNIEGHPSLMSRWYMSDVPREVAATGAHVIQAPSLCNPGILVWTRTIPRTLGKDGGQVKLTPIRERCDQAVYIADAAELAELVSTHTLSPHLSQIRQLCDCKLTLIAFNLNDYFKKKGRGSQNSVHRGQRRKTSNSNRTPMNEIDFQLAVTDLLVSANCDTLMVNTSNELALSIVQITKSIAEAPAKKAKRACDAKAGFYMRGENKNCVAVDKNGNGVGRLWQQMLAILPQSSLETSRAICAQYKSPLAFYQAIQSKPPAASIAHLADIGVTRAAAGGSRRVGREFARKLHTLFTATNGDLLIE